MGEKHEYPKRPSHFAHKFVRVLAKACIANELGSDVCWLLTVIAHTEDAGGYRKSVTFHNGQLAAICGFGSESKLKRARAKAIGAGWLRYTPGSRGGAPKYWVVVAEKFRGMDDLPSDERPDKYGVTDGTTATNGATSDLQVNSKRTPSDLQVNSDRSQSGLLSSLHLHLNQETPLPPSGENEANDVGPNPEAVAEVWNRQVGLTACQELGVHRERIIRQWATGNPSWVRHWRAVIEFMGRTPFYCGENRDHWRADLTWLLRDQNFTQVVDKMLAARPKPTAYDPREQLRATLRKLVRSGSMDREEAEERLGGPLDDDRQGAA